MLTEFVGFAPQSFLFLENLSQNNNKIWFDAHKKEYQTTILLPFLARLEELTSGYELHGENYKRVLNSNVSQLLAPWYQKKSFYIAYQKPKPAHSVTASLVSEIAQAFTASSALYQYLLKIALSSP